MTHDDDHGMGIERWLDRLATGGDARSDCMFQLALMVARIALEPCADAYKDEASRMLLDVIRAKPKSDVVRLFSATSAKPTLRGRRLMNA